MVHTAGLMGVFGYRCFKIYSENCRLLFINFGFHLLDICTLRSRGLPWPESPGFESDLKVECLNVTDLISTSCMGCFICFYFLSKSCFMSINTVKCFYSHVLQFFLLSSMLYCFRIEGVVSQEQIRSYELSLRRTFAPTNFRSYELSLL